MFVTFGATLKEIFSFIYADIIYCDQSILSSDKTYAPNPRVLNGTGHILSKFFQKFNFDGSGIVGKPINTYYGSNGHLGLDTVQTYATNIGTSNHMDAHQTADNVVNFYYGFKQYMPTTFGFMSTFREIFSAYSALMYYLDTLLQKAYVSLFDLMDISHEYGGGSGTLHSNSMDTINGWWHFGQELGFVICGVMLLFFLISAIISSRASTFGRFKDVFWNLFIGTFFVFMLPTLTGFAASGAQSVAQGGLGHGQNMAKQIFYTNVYSIPHKVLGMKADSKPFPIAPYGHNNAPLVYGAPQDEMVTKKEARDGNINPVKARPININLQYMGPREQDSWNGLREQSIYSFLWTYASSDDVLGKTNLKSFYKTIQAKKKADKKIDKSGYEPPSQSKANADIMLPPTLVTNAKTRKAKRSAKQNKPQTNVKVNRNPTGATKKQQKHLNKMNKRGRKAQKKASKTDTESSSDPDNNDSSLSPKAMAYVFKYRLSGEGDDAAIRRLPGFRKGPLGWSLIMPVYGMYKVNVINIVLFLTFLACIFIAFSWKIIGAFWKALVLYATSGIMIAHSITNKSKIKEYINTYFSLFEMLMLDVVFIRLYFVAFDIMNNNIVPDAINYASAYGGFFTGGIANTYGQVGVAIIKIIFDFGLFLACIDGIKIIDNDLGTEGATGAHQSWMRDLMMFHFAGNALRSIGHGATALAGGIGGKGASAKGASASSAGKRPKIKPRNSHRNGKKRNRNKNPLKNAATSKDAKKLGKSTKFNPNGSNKSTNSNKSASNKAKATKPKSSGSNRGSGSSSARPRPSSSASGSSSSAGSFGSSASGSSPSSDSGPSGFGGDEPGATSEDNNGNSGSDTADNTNETSDDGSDSSSDDSDSDDSSDDSSSGFGGVSVPPATGGNEPVDNNTSDDTGNNTNASNNNANHANNSNNSSHKSAQGHNVKPGHKINNSHAGKVNHKPNKPNSHQTHKNNPVQHLTHHNTPHHTARKKGTYGKSIDNGQGGTEPRPFQRAKNQSLRTQANANSNKNSKGSSNTQTGSTNSNSDSSNGYTSRDYTNDPYYTQSGTDASDDVYSSGNGSLNSKSGDTKDDPNVNGNNIPDTATQRGVDVSNEAGTSNPNDTSYAPSGASSSSSEPSFDSSNIDNAPALGDNGTQSQVTGNTGSTASTNVGSSASNPDFTNLALGHKTPNVNSNANNSGSGINFANHNSANAKDNTNGEPNNNAQAQHSNANASAQHLQATNAHNRKLANTESAGAQAGHAKASQVNKANANLASHNSANNSPLDKNEANNGRGVDIQATNAENNVATGSVNKSGQHPIHENTGYHANDSGTVPINSGSALASDNSASTTGGNNVSTGTDNNPTDTTNNEAGNGFSYNVADDNGNGSDTTDIPNETGGNVPDNNQTMTTHTTTDNNQTTTGNNTSNPIDTNNNEAGNGYSSNLTDDNTNIPNENGSSHTTTDYQTNTDDDQTTNGGNTTNPTDTNNNEAGNGFSHLVTDNNGGGSDNKTIDVGDNGSIHTDTSQPSGYSNLFDSGATTGNNNHVVNNANDDTRTHPIHKLFNDSRPIANPHQYHQLDNNTNAQQAYRDAFNKEWNHDTNNAPHTSSSINPHDFSGIRKAGEERTDEAEREADENDNGSDNGYSSLNRRIQHIIHQNTHSQRDMRRYHELQRQRQMLKNNNKANRDNKTRNHGPFDKK